MWVYQIKKPHCPVRPLTRVTHRQSGYPWVTQNLGTRDFPSLPCGRFGFVGNKLAEKQLFYNKAIQSGFMNEILISGIHISSKNFMTMLIEHVLQ